jgi:hypothetical protein
MPLKKVSVNDVFLSVTFLTTVTVEYQSYKNSIKINKTLREKPQTPVSVLSLAFSAINTL